MDADSNKFSLTMFYSYENGSKQLICTMDYADMQYESTLHSYKSKRYNSHVIFWKIEHEFCPTFKVYYLENGRLTNVGDWRMYTPCKTCDAQDYSLTDVKIKKKGKEMELLFSRDVVISDYDKKLFKGNWMLFNAGTLILTFNTKDGQLRKK